MHRTGAWQDTGLSPSGFHSSLEPEPPWHTGKTGLIFVLKNWLRAGEMPQWVKAGTGTCYQDFDVWDQTM